MDVEAIMYEHARELGITLFTVSHRTTLVRHHDWLLRFDGEGHYEFRELDADDQATPFRFGGGGKNGKNSEDKGMEADTEESSSRVGSPNGSMSERD